jgi:Holliday junction resolvasome RuvABC endonuclease subunit
MDFPMNQPLKVLGLDLGSNLGWADSIAGIIDSGSVAFVRRTGRKTISDDHEGIKFLEFHKWLKGYIRLQKPDLIAYEEPMGHWKNASAPQLILGFRGIILMNAAFSNIPVYPIPQTVLKKYATGKGNADKELVLECAKLRFPTHNIQSHDQADALFILHKFLSDSSQGRPG